MSADGGASTADKLSKLIASLGPEKRGLLAELLREPPEPIAIVGMSCRFAGADSPDGLWRALLDGVDGITRVPKSRWDAEALLERSPDLAPTGWGGFIEGVDQFEPAVFGISPREAVQIDPQQRLILEGIWEALEDAGLPLEAVAGTATGVFIGACGGGEYATLCARDPQAVGSHTGTGVSNNMLAGRVSYIFDLHGPSVVVDTACSSSLVAVHLACESLRRRESALAVVGGVNLVLSPEVMRVMLEMQLLAGDGRCKVFDARADGIARGEGCGVVVLKRLGDALASRDRVIAIVRGTAVNHDGRSNGLTAPAGSAQREVIERALAAGGVPPAAVGYVEAHGTGTALGDPIEVEALKEVLGRGRGAGDRCVLGSLKANLGHTEGAAGVAGLIKAALSLSRGIIPPQINFRRLNPHIALENTPFVVSREPLAWPADGKPWIAGVSSFGWSGTNAHAVLEAVPSPAAAGEQAAADGDGRPMVLPISARSPADLRALAERWSAFLAEGTHPLADVAYTAAVRRSHHRFRRLVVGATRRELVDGLRAVAAGEEQAPAKVGGARPELRAGAAERIVFVFSGPGSQWVGMGRGLLSEKVFRDSLAACDAALEAVTGWSAADMLTSDAAAQRWTEEVAVPLIFAMQVSLAALWRSWGIEPDAVVGDGLGEVAAAHVAGALDLADAARAIVLRSRKPPLGAELQALLAAIRPRAAGVPIYSTAKAEPIPGELMGAAYWSATNPRQPAPSPPSLEGLMREGHAIFLEISPQPVLAPSIESTLSAIGMAGAALGSTRREEDERRSLLDTLGSLYALGRSVEWERLFTAAGNVVSLPTYAWQREAYWPARTDGRRGPAMAFGQGLLAGDGLTLPDGTRVWEAELSPAVSPYLGDHRVAGRAIVTPAAYLEMALEAGRAIFGRGARCVVENVRLEQLLELPAQGTRMAQLLFTPRAGGAGSFRIASPSAAGWSVHASGDLRAAREPAAASAQPPAAIASRCPRPVGVDEFYEAIRRGGIDLGPRLRRLDRVVGGAGEVLARLRPADPTARAMAGEVDPTLLDACFQASGAAISTVAPGLLVPVAIGSVVVGARPEGALSAHACIVDQSARGDRPRGDVLLLGEDGQVFVELRDLQFQRVGPSRRLVDDWMFAVDWEPQSLPAPPARAGNAWVALGDEALAGALRQPVEEAGHRLAFSPDVAQAVRRLSASADPDVGGIVYLAPDVGAEAIADGAVETWAGVLAIVETVAAAKLARPPRLWLVTRGAQPAGGGPVAPALAALWGLGRTIALEHPELRCACVDLPASPDADALAALADELRSDLDENQIALRGRERRVARLTRARAGDRRPRPARGRSFHLAGDGLRAFARREPAAGEVELAVSAATLDRTPGRPAACAGRITAVGPTAAARFAVGDEVVALVAQEPATHVAIDAGAVIPLPPALGAQLAAATLPIVAAAHHAVVGLARVGREAVFISDGACPQGRAAARIAAAAGASVVALGGAPGERFRTIPPDSSPADALAANGGRRYDVVIGTGAAWDDLSDPNWSALLAPLGRWVSAGPSSATPTPPNVWRLTADLRALAVEAPAGLAAAIQGAEGHLAALGGAVDVRGVPIAQLEAQLGAAAGQRGPLTVVTMDDPETPIAAAETAPAIGGDTYLVTGGLGRLGLETARWLVAKGARHLVLADRRDPPPEAGQAIGELAAGGVEVVVARCDVAEPREVAGLLERIRTEMPALRGIVHAAGAIDDGGLERVMAPKVRGAWNLHTRTRGTSSLDFFVMFSSSGAVLGSPGHGSDAAASAFLDGLAHLRAAAGLPAISIGWDAGLAAADAMAALDRVLELSAPQIAVMRLELRGPGDAAGLPSAWPLLSRLLSERAPQAAPAARLRDELAALAPSERRHRLQTEVKAEIAGLLRLPAAAVDAAAPLNALGFDSLMDLELRDRLEARFGMRLPSTVLWASRSIEELVPYLAKLMGAPVDEEAPPNQAAAAPAEPPTEADLLPDDQIEAALLAKLDRLDRTEEDHA